MFSAMNIASSGMSASKEWLEVTTNNISNINTTRTEDGGPYHRQNVIFKEKNGFDDLFSKEMGDGVKVDKIAVDTNEKVVFDPKHPDANQEGYVRYPAINLAAEMTNLVQAQRAYESNVTVFNDLKKVMQKELEIGRV